MMAKNQYARTLYLITLNTQKVNQEMLDALKLLCVDVPIVSPEEISLHYQEYKHKILLLSYGEHQALRQALSPIQITEQRFEVVLFDVPKRLTTHELLGFGRLRGMFYQGMPTAEMAVSLADIINGRIRFPEHVSEQLINYWQAKLHQEIPHPFPMLSQRETEILRNLCSASSNTELADTLFISELTVKSHLYNIYKKLNVKNRVEAIEWAKQTLRL